MAVDFGGSRRRCARIPSRRCTPVSGCGALRAYRGGRCGEADDHAAGQGVRCNAVPGQRTAIRSAGRAGRTLLPAHGDRRGTMAEIGMNVGPDGIVDPNDLAESGARWIRIVATGGNDVGDYMKACQDKQVKVLLAIARESLPTLVDDQSNLAEA